MILIRARLGENLNTPVAQFVVLGRKWVLVDANFANRGLGWKLPAGKSVDVDLPAVGPGGRASQRFQILLQFIGIVRQSFEILALDYDGAGVIRCVGAYAYALILNFQLFFFFE